ncbi:prephenate dehydrogenase [Cumulibacter manganitolerans]|uniref:prephenate dehydrogenase n=1 Tax=Cumulibacter manganitolerans TaxID=1884992 RepID=UPI001295E2C9|nr:prephenate dehydrogenase/arogenate dehydrogenase family protein [Cumulibacter manganitolerans]
MPTAPPVAIIGLGLIGGSLALRLRAAGSEVWAHDTSAETLEAAGVHDIRPFPGLEGMLAALPDGSLVVVATPLEDAVALMPVLALLTDDQVTITDVVSVKSAVLEAARAAGLADRYVGAHPMAGTTESGFAAAGADLLREATWVVALEDDTDLDRWVQVCRLALGAGGRVVPTDAEWHDHAAAWISHLPHVLAEVLAANVEPRGLAGALAAGSYRDATRVAGTRPELVAAMLNGNRRMLTEVLESFLDQLEQATVAVRDGSVADLVARGYEHRRQWQARRDGSASTTPVRIPLGDPGARQRLREVGAAGGFIVSHEDGAVTALA